MARGPRRDHQPSGDADDLADVVRRKGRDRADRSHGRCGSYRTSRRNRSHRHRDDRCYGPHGCGRNYRAGRCNRSQRGYGRDRPGWVERESRVRRADRSNRGGGAGRAECHPSFCLFQHRGRRKLRDLQSCFDRRIEYRCSSENGRLFDHAQRTRGIVSESE